MDLRKKIANSVAAAGIFLGGLSGGCGSSPNTATQPFYYRDGNMTGMGISRGDYNDFLIFPSSIDLIISYLRDNTTRYQRVTVSPSNELGTSVDKGWLFNIRMHDFNGDNLVDMVESEYMTPPNTYRQAFRSSTTLLTDQYPFAEADRLLRDVKTSFGYNSKP